MVQKLYPILLCITFEYLYLINHYLFAGTPDENQESFAEISMLRTSGLALYTRYKHLRSSHQRIHTYIYSSDINCCHGQ